MSKWRKLIGSLEFRLFLAIWLVYALHVVPAGGVNPNRSFDLIHSLVDEHRVAIDSFHENTIDKAFKDGHFYPLGLPGPSLVGIPSYVTFKIAYGLLPNKLFKPLANVQSFKQGSEGGFYQKDTTSFFLSTIWITWFSLSLLSALAAVALFRTFLLLGVTRSNSLLATIAYAFGTPVFFYSTTYFSAVFAASFAIFSLYVLTRLGSSRRAPALLLLGLLVASAVLMEYQGLFLAGGVALYLWFKWGFRASWSFFLGAALPCAILLSYNTLVFGGPFHSAYEFVVGPNTQFHNVGALGFTMPRPARLFGLTLSAHRGLFIYSPVLLLSLVGFASALRRRKQQTYGLVLLSILVTAGVWLWISSFEAWDGSSAFGPRLLVSILPFMAIGLALSLSKVPRALSYPLIALSVMINWLGAQYGFAENIWEPWRRFWTSGFTLPALSAVASHSRGENSLTLFIANRMWLIAVIYAALLVGCSILIIQSLLRDRSKPIVKEELLGNQI